MQRFASMSHNMQTISSRLECHALRLEQWMTTQAQANVCEFTLIESIEMLLMTTLNC